VKNESILRMRSSRKGCNCWRANCRTWSNFWKKVLKYFTKKGLVLINPF